MALVSRWKFNNDYTDSVGTNHGVNTNCTLTTGAVSDDYCASVTSSPIGYITLGSINIASYTNFSVSLWFKSNSPGAEQYLIMDWTYPSGADQRLSVLIQTNSRIRVLPYVGGSFYAIDSPTTLTTSAWNHLVLTVSGSGTSLYTLYLNGKKDIYSTRPRSTLSSSSFRLGVHSPNTTDAKFNGYMDDARFYDTALSEDEVSDLYKSYSIPRWQTPISRWDLDNDATDMYGLHNGTASNVTYSTDSKSKGLSGSFNGSSSLINCGSWSFASYTNFSISLWIKVSGTSDAFLTCTRPGYDFPRIQFMTASAGGLNYVVVSDVGAVLYEGGGPLCNNGVWHHVVLVDANGTIGCYFDGSVTALSGSYTRANLSNLTSVYMGMMVLSSNNRPFAGLMDDVRFYDVALTADEVLALYRSYETPKWDQPLHRWKLDGNAIDSVGGADGTAVGTVEYSRASKVTGNYSLKCDGGADYIDLGAFRFYNYTNLSISIWFKTNQTAAQVLIADYSTTATAYYRLNVFNGLVYFQIWDGDGSFINSLNDASTRTYNDNNWHNFVLTDANGTYAGYIDGILDTGLSGSYTRFSLSMDNYSAIGACKNTGSQTYFNGLMDDIRFYDYALSAAEVRSLYNSYFTEKAASMMEMLG